MDKHKLLAETARRRGFFWGSYEVYGGLSGFLDLGPFGTILKGLIEKSWRESFLLPHGFLEISTPIITPQRVLEASGHVENFKDPMVECTNCKRRFRADQLIKEAAGIETEGLTLEKLSSLFREKQVKCPECGGVLGEPQYFLTMFKTNIGPYGEDPAYCRPEAAQGIFVNFPRVYETSREKFPLGIAQIGTVLRNEISPRQGPIRLREFTIMDFELFFDPEDPECPYLDQVSDDRVSIVTEAIRKAGKDSPIELTIEEALGGKVIRTSWAAYFMALAKRFVSQLGISDEKQRFFEKLPTERAHYSAQTFDHEVQLDRYGWVEVAGFAYRSDYDLRKHMEATGVDMRVFKPYSSPVEKTVRSVRINHEKIHRLYGKEAGKIIGLLSKQNLEVLLEMSKRGEAIKILGHELPADIFETREEIVKESGRRFLPHVVEPSFGVERLVYASLESNLTMRDDRVILTLPFKLAPVQAAIYPLVNRDGLDAEAVKIHRSLLSHGFRVEYDEAGSIGRRYARADEAGIPLGITVDYDTAKDSTVTLRDRDSWRQIRVKIEALESTMSRMAKEGFPNPDKVRPA
jgi:glycyl-tRNA synthetase